MLESIWRRLWKRRDLGVDRRCTYVVLFLDTCVVAFTALSLLVDCVGGIVTPATGGLA